MNKILLSAVFVVGAIATANANEYTGGNYENFLGHYYSNGGSGEQTTQPKKIIKIPSHWGAVAFDANKMITGVSENVLDGERSAKKQALQDCHNRGGENCKIIGRVKNMCAAYGVVTKQNKDVYVPFRSADTKSEAEDLIREECRKGKGVKCEVFYSHCNKDPRY